MHKLSATTKPLLLHRCRYSQFYFKAMEKELFKIFWKNVKSTYPEGTSKHTNAILEEDFEKVWSEILDLISVRKTEEKLKEVFQENEADIDSKSDFYFGWRKCVDWLSSKNWL